MSRGRQVSCIQKERGASRSQENNMPSESDSRWRYMRPWARCRGVRASSTSTRGLPGASAKVTLPAGISGGGAGAAGHSGAGRWGGGAGSARGTGQGASPVWVDRGAAGSAGWVAETAARGCGSGSTARSQLAPEQRKAQAQTNARLRRGSEIICRAHNTSAHGSLGLAPRPDWRVDPWPASAMLCGHASPVCPGPVPRLRLWRHGRDRISGARFGGDHREWREQRGGSCRRWRHELGWGQLRWNGGRDCGRRRTRGRDRRVCRTGVPRRAASTTGVRV